MVILSILSTTRFFGVVVLYDSKKNWSPRSRFGHNVRRPTQFVCPNSDKICPNSDKIYLTIVTFYISFAF